MSEQLQQNSARPAAAPSGPVTGPLKLAVMSAFASGSEVLALAENRILSRLASDAELLRTIPQYLLEQGGKRIRPLLAALSYRALSSSAPSDDLVDVAAGIELIHMATLLHDDIIDQSPTRRHQASAFRRFGLTPSLLAGDFLLVRAFGLCARLDPFIVAATERACVELTEGELLEGTLDGESVRSIEDYVDIVGKKTAALFALACESGAFLARSSAETVEHMRRFGYFAGVAFQMVDDILDVTADEDLLGKPAGTDLRQKTPSLVNILWLAAGDDEARSFFSMETISAELSKEMAAKLRDSVIVEQCRERAKEYAARAEAELSAIRKDVVNTDVCDQLSAIVEYTLERCL